MGLLVLPTDPDSDEYKLLPGKQFYTSRRKPVVGIVLHIVAGLEDLGLDTNDESAEGTMKWALNTGAKVSWHAGVDTEDVTLGLPDWYTAYQATGYNSSTVGLEISKRHTDWSVMNPIWVTRTLRKAARYCAAIVKKYDLPLRLSDKAQVDWAIANNQPFGFTYHMWTSAGTRSDPGKDFPWMQFIQYVKEELEDFPEDDMFEVSDRTRMERIEKSLTDFVDIEAKRYAIYTGRYGHIAALIKSVADKIGAPVDVDETALAKSLLPLMLPTITEAVKESPIEGVTMSPEELADRVVAKIGQKLGS